MDKSKESILTLFFPCEYRFKKKKKPYPYSENIIKEEKKQLKNQYIPLVIKKSFETRKAEIENKKQVIVGKDWEKTESIFNSCHIKEDISYFEYQAFYPTFGISISRKFNNKEEIKAWLKVFYKEYQAKNPELTLLSDTTPVSKELPVWLVYDKPIALIQTEDVKKIYTDKIENDIVVYSGLCNNSDMAISESEYVILLCMVLKTYSSRIIWKMKNVLRNNNCKSDELSDLRKIHDECALFNNLFYHPNPCRSDLEFELFDQMKKELNFNRVNRQILSAKELLDYRNELDMSAKSASIDKTVFITGYIGVILALFAFCNLYGTDMVDFVNPGICGWDYCILAAVICGLFIGVVKIYSVFNIKISSKLLAFFIWLFLIVIIGATCYFLLFSIFPFFKIS